LTWRKETSHSETQVFARVCSLSPLLLAVADNAGY
jgi:hypothetical protein